MVVGRGDDGGVALLVSVNIGTPRPAAWAGIGRTSIDKTPQAGPVLVRRLGLDGDQISNTRHHGGPDQAVYAFAAEDLRTWGEALGAVLPHGQFGENLTTSGIDVNEAEIGSRWEVGDTLLEVASIRTPCGTFKAWQQHSGFDATAWVKRFTAVARPGAYLRVLGEGAVRVGDEIRVVHEPGHGVTVSLMFRALYLDRTLLPRLLDVPEMVDQARVTAEAYVAAQQVRDDHDTTGRPGPVAAG